MHTWIKTIGAVAIAGGVALGAVGPAAAAPNWWMYHHPYHRYYSHPYYGPGYYGYDPGAAVAAGIIGGIFGTIASTAINGGGSHLWRCEHTYRSYVPATNTYTGYDGKTYACTL